MALKKMNSSSLTVLFLRSPGNLGGQERRIIDEAQLIMDAGHRPLIVCPPDAVLYCRAAETGFTVFGGHDPAGGAVAAP